MTNIYHTCMLVLCAMLLSFPSACQNKSSAEKISRSEDIISTRSLPRPIGYINDFENIYSDNEEAILDSLVSAFEARTTIQIAVLSIDSTLTTSEDFDDYTLRIANDWGVGQIQKDNGIVIGISRAFRKIRIQNGLGLEKMISDLETKMIIEIAFIPKFREGKYFGGTYDGLLELMKLLGQRSSETANSKWQGNFLDLREAIMNGDKKALKNFVDFPIKNPGNEIWYVADSKFVMELSPDEIKPFTEKDYDRYFSSIFTIDLRRTIKELDPNELFINLKSSSPEIAVVGNSRSKLEASLDKSKNELTLSMITASSEFGKFSIDYIFGITHDQKIEFKLVRASM